MARPIRIDVEAGVYHVMSRGNDRCALFKESADYRHFLDRLALGAASFVESIRRMVCDDPEYEGRRALKRRFEWDEIVQMVKRFEDRVAKDPVVRESMTQAEQLSIVQT